MKLFRKRIEFLNWRNDLKSTLGLVPTMGNLHQGHLSLTQRALNENENVVVTIFVNPKQFGPNEDFDQYPRTLEEDLNKLATLEGSDRLIIFNPESNDEIYPENFQTSISVNGLDKVLCGRFRDGHFSGVTTVVYQLFALTKADQAYFGQKDFQQFKIIERMAKDLMLPIRLHMCPIIREEDGLALSSRNQYLNSTQREEAVKLNQKLNEIANVYKNQGKKSAISLRDVSLQEDLRFQYIELLETQSLTGNIPTSYEGYGKVVVAGAFILGDTRLIDNLLI